MNLLSFQKPSRYINHEINSCRKNAAVSIALAFPDIYEIGMSHLGLKILYDIINSIPFCSAERVFSPWTDLEEGMRKSGVLLSSLESQRPLREFDIVGFSLQYELSYPTVLNMLDLGGLPVRTEDRMDMQTSPLVIAGGPCTLNPAPMAPFVDAFLVGDGEEAIREILAAVHSWKQEGARNKSELFRELSNIEGLYIPSLKSGKKVTRRIIDSLDDSPFPVRPVVPYAGIVHDRVNIEIARGCSMGCRFCQAGMAYRPVRERSVQTVLSLAEASLRNTGYDTLSFTSLNAGDYSHLLPLLHECNKHFASKRISLSLPSLKVGSVTNEMLEEIKSVRKTGFTIAPEAGTDRLRAVINKDVSEETYLKALETLFKAGWNNLKLYFMTGLPTETDQDISAIPDMVRQALKISRTLTGRHVNISIGVSSFVPKPHTPFQWCGQESIQSLREKNRFLKRSFLSRGVKFKGHDEAMSMLEAAFARGDEATASVIEEAWKRGCRLDAWTEQFHFETWEQAMDAVSIDLESYAMKTFTQESTFPWDVVDTGIIREFLWREYQKALSGEHSPDCQKQCHACGLKCDLETKNTRLQDSQLSVSCAAALSGDDSVRVRMVYSKTGPARYLSHLELVTALLRALRRAGFRFRYSSGYHPAPKVSFGPALGVGIAGSKEYMDIELEPPFESETYLGKLREQMPEGMHVHALEMLSGREKSLNSFVSRYTYEVQNARPEPVEAFMALKEKIIERKKGPVNIRTMVEEVIQREQGVFHVAVCDTPEAHVRIDEIFPELFGESLQELAVTRIGMYGWDGRWTEPVEGVVEWAVKS